MVAEGFKVMIFARMHGLTSFSLLRPLAEFLFMVRERKIASTLETSWNQTNLPQPSRHGQ